MTLNDDLDCMHHFVRFLRVGQAAGATHGAFVGSFDQPPSRYDGGVIIFDTEGFHKRRHAGVKRPDTEVRAIAKLGVDRQHQVLHKAK
jgi:hypothetical protein